MAFAYRDGVRPHVGRSSPAGHGGLAGRRGRGRPV